MAEIQQRAPRRRATSSRIDLSPFTREPGIAAIRGDQLGSAGSLTALPANGLPWTDHTSRLHRVAAGSSVECNCEYIR